MKEFKMKYKIIPDYIEAPSKRRPGIPINKVLFVVVHDTGNPGSTARNNVTYYKRTKDKESISAHIFVDDKEIIECIPALTTDKPEKAWHVIYNVTTDNKMFGDDANDAAIGIEYCYGKNINAEEAYKRYVWVTAYTCFKYGLNPAKNVVGHFILDPARKTDPKNGLKACGKTYDQFLKDVIKEYEECIIDKEKEGKEEVLLDWQKKIGHDAIMELHNKGMLHNPDEWLKKLDQNVPMWLFFEMIRRVNEKMEGRK